MVPYEALYGRKCISPVCWDDIVERRLFRPELIVRTIDKVKQIRGHLKTAQDRQKSWADAGRRPLDFTIGTMCS